MNRKPSTTKVILGVLVLLGISFGLLQSKSKQRTAHPPIIAPLKSVEAVEGEVRSVPDGDSLVVIKNGQEVKVRLFGIDCPEYDQPFGTAAKSFTRQRVLGRKVHMIELDRDRYGRIVAEVSYAPPAVEVEGLAADRSVNLNRELVRAGLAWAYVRYSEKFLPDEKHARSLGLGIWSDPSPIPPWEHRAKKRP